MRLLGLSDDVHALIYSPRVSVLYHGIDLIISCGDLPYEYLDYVVCRLDKPLFYVEGNHVRMQEDGTTDPGSKYHGGFDLHRKVMKYGNTILAGVAGSIRYSRGPNQYTQSQMWINVLGLLPGLFVNKVIHGRYLDIFVTHAPPHGIHDQPDLPHQGIKAFLWLDRVFQPSLHVHGHIHTYRPDTVSETVLGRTRIINTYPYKEIFLDHLGG
jgi:uncharacterized protein